MAPVVFLGLLAGEYILEFLSSAMQYSCLYLFTTMLFVGGLLLKGVPGPLSVAPRWFAFYTEGRV